MKHFKSAIIFFIALSSSNHNLSAARGNLWVNLPGDDSRSNLFCGGNSLGKTSENRPSYNVYTNRQAVSKKAMDVEKIIEEHKHEDLGKIIKIFSQHVRDKDKKPGYNVPEALTQFMEVTTVDKNLNKGFDSLHLNLNTKEALSSYKKDAQRALVGQGSLPKPLFLSGPPGAGKTYTIVNLAKDIKIDDKSGLPYVEINYPSVDADALKLIEAELTRTNLDDKNKDNPPLGSAIVLMDEIDCIARDRGTLSGEDRKLATQLLLFMNNIKKFNELQLEICKTNSAYKPTLIFLMFAANYPVDQAFMDRCNSVPYNYPTDDVRKTILIKGLEDRKFRNIESDTVLLQKLTEATKGFSLRDITRVLDAGLSGKMVSDPFDWFKPAIMQIVNDHKRVFDNELSGKAKVLYREMDEIKNSKLEDFKLSLGNNVYKAIRDATKTICDSKKAKVREAILLYGPPGTGKTEIAKAIANKAGCNLITVSSGSLLTKYQGSGSEAMLVILSQAESMAPCMIFLDEVDAIGGQNSDSPERGNLRITLQTAMTTKNTLGMPICFLAATNYPEELEAALLSRFRTQLLIPNPGYAGVIDILAKKISDSLELSSKEDIAKILLALHKTDFLKNIKVVIDKKLSDGSTSHFISSPSGRILVTLAENACKRISRDRHLSSELEKINSVPGALLKEINRSDKPKWLLLDEVEEIAKQKEFDGEAERFSQTGRQEYERLREIYSNQQQQQEQKVVVKKINKISDQEIAIREKIFGNTFGEYRENSNYQFVKDLATTDPQIPEGDESFAEFLLGLVDDRGFTQIFERQAEFESEPKGMLDYFKRYDDVRNRFFQRSEISRDSKLIKSSDQKSIDQKSIDFGFSLSNGDLDNHIRSIPRCESFARQLTLSRKSVSRQSAPGRPERIPLKPRLLLTQDNLKKLQAEYLSK